MELEVTWKNVLRIWWALAWRSYLYALGAILVVGIVAIVILVAYMFAFKADTNKVIEALIAYDICLRVLGYLVSALVNVYVFKKILGKNLKKFKVAIIANGQHIEATYKITLKVWWAKTWRDLLIGTLIGAVFLILLTIGAAFISAKIVLNVLFTTMLPLGFLVTLYILKIVLKKDYKTFRIALLANDKMEPTANA